tara:strand:- start:71 stop:298 length:228 start_codon:yes stop_codon:yes gene_type:complete
MAKTETEINFTADYVRNTLFSSEVSALNEGEYLSVSADIDGNISVATNVESIDATTKFNTAKDGGNTNLVGWGIV